MGSYGKVKDNGLISDVENEVASSRFRIAKSPSRLDCLVETLEGGLSVDLMAKAGFQPRHIPVESTIDDGMPSCAVPCCSFASEGVGDDGMGLRLLVMAGDIGAARA